MKSDNPFRLRTLDILINDTMNKSLYHVSCEDCILDTKFPANEPTTTNNCNPIFGQRSDILLEHNNKVTFHARTVSNCELIRFYSIDIKPVALRNNYQHSSAILNNLTSFRFPMRMRRNLTNYLLEKSGIADSLTYATNKINETTQCYFTKQRPPPHLIFRLPKYRTPTPIS